MAELSNATEDKTILKQSCSAEFTEEVHGELIFLPAINIFFSFTAFLGNTLILVALHKVSSCNVVTFAVRIATFRIFECIISL